MRSLSLSFSLCVCVCVCVCACSYVYMHASFVIAINTDGAPACAGVQETTSTRIPEDCRGCCVCAGGAAVGRDGR